MSSNWAPMSRRAPVVLRDLASVGSLVVLVSVSASIYKPDKSAAPYEVLTLTAAGVGAAAALLAELAARLSDIPRVAWSGAALAVYSIVIIPSSTLGPDGMITSNELRAVRLIAYLTVVVLLLLAARPSRRGGAWGGWVIAGAGTLFALACGWATSFVPDSIVEPVLERSVTTVALVCWCWVAAVYVQQGVRLGRPPMWRIGLGVAVLAGAQLYRLGTMSDLSQPNVGFAALRLLGLVVVAGGIGTFWLHVMRSFRADREQQAEELRMAAVHLQRAADAGARRDHEFRNGIGGLVGITALLSAPAEECNRPLRAAVLAELGRLSEMVNGRAVDEAAGTEIAAVLHQVAALHRARGAEVAVDAPLDLWADIPDPALRQVLANVLANAQRHAAGSPVELNARLEGSVVVLEVRDDGPGVPPGREERVFEAGERDVDAGGSGLGLHICRELLAEHGGTVRILPYDPGRPGCMVVITLGAGLPTVLADDDPDFRYGAVSRGRP